MPALAAIVGIDWGTTRRRIVALDAGAAVVCEFDDDEGLLAPRTSFASSLAAVLERVASPEVVMSGMVGSAQGWHEVPYLDAEVPLDALPAHLYGVPDAPRGTRCRIVPGYRWHGADGSVDVMRGEETQLLGALLLGHRDGWFVLPGTHCKWVRLRDGCIESLATYISGELFALLSQHGTLAALMREARDDAGAFDEGVAAAGRGALSNALFGCRARVVSRDMPAAAARDYLSGLLVGAEWHDALARGPVDAVRLIGDEALVRRHCMAAERFGVEVDVLDPRAVHRAALVAFAR